MKCPLCASWKACKTHSLAGCTHQTVKGIEWLCELILTSLQASSRLSGNARRQSANWKLLIWCGGLSACICLEIRGLQKQHHMHSACCIPASGRNERNILDRAKLVCTFSQPLQMLSLKALCKCMHECLTQALTRTVAGFTKSRLIFFRASFTYKLCDTNSSDLSVWSSFAPFCICTTVPNGLPVLAFADSKRSQPLRIRSAHIASGFQMIPNHYLNWFGGMPSAQILRSCMGLVVVWLWISILLLFFCFLGGLLSMGKQSIGKLCRMSGHPLLQKARTFGLALNKHSKFQYTVPSHIQKLYGSFGGKGVLGAKSPAFCNGRHS